MNQTDLLRTYGDPGVHRGYPDPAWVKANIVTLHDLPGVPAHWFFSCHRLVEPRMRAAFAAALVAAPEYRIERAGCWVFRHQRHDQSRPLSDHSWGTAVDIDAARNASHTFAVPGRQPAPWSPMWMELWPNGLPRAFVEAFEAHGFEWGGRWHGFVDPMHMQARE
jgi:hypothetical protein